MMRAPSAATREVGSVQDIDLKRARLDPTAVFPSPEAVVEHPRLSREQKVDILKVNSGVSSRADPASCAGLRW